MRLNQGQRQLWKVGSAVNTSTRIQCIARKQKICNVDLGEEYEKGEIKGEDIEGEGILSSIRGFMAGDRETARPGFKGERHALLKLKNGVGKANYMGPGTHVSERLARGDPPRTMEDAVAQAHDIRYGLAKNQRDVSNADRKMIGKLKDMKKKKQGNRFNIELGLRPIQAKLAMESRGLIKPGRIASFGDLKKSERGMASKRLGELEQEGYGPADMLRARLLAKVNRTKRRAKTSKGARKKKRGRGLSLPGAGLILPGSGVASDIKKKLKKINKKALAKKMSLFVLKQLMPILIKKLQEGTGLKLAGQGLMKNKKIQSLVEMRILKRLNDGASRDGFEIVGTGVMPSKKKMVNISKDIAKMVLPILISAAARSANKKIRGSGRILTQKDFDNFKTPLVSRLTTGVLKSLFHFFKNRSGAGGGCCRMSAQQGEGFFGDFVRGFKKGFSAVMTPALKVAKTLAPLAPLLL